MTAAGLLAVYCVIILLASLLGGWLPVVVRLTHRRMETALSFVSGVMLGVAMLHLLPHAALEFAAAAPSVIETSEGQDHAHDNAHGEHMHDSVTPTALWLISGFLVMFFIERFFCYHHHDPPGNLAEEGSGGGCDHRHHHHGKRDQHALTWTGAMIGLTLHTLITGIALAASVESEWPAKSAGFTLAGFGTFLVVVLHKPFDSLTIGTLMAAGNRSLRSRHLVNLIFSLVVPLGAILFYLGMRSVDHMPHRSVGAALAFSAGTFLCISLSDLLPELQFHRHDRIKLSLALLAGVALAWAISVLEAAGH